MKLKFSFNVYTCNAIINIDTTPEHHRQPVEASSARASSANVNKHVVKFECIFFANVIRLTINIYKLLKWVYSFICFISGYCSKVTLKDNILNYTRYVS